MFSVLGLNIEYVKLTAEDKGIYQQYLTAKQEKNFEKSDKIRKILIDKGIM
jgi:cysteinyl-tRNA synthetase